PPRLLPPAPLLFSTLPRHPRPTLFPYTTLFRSPGGEQTRPLVAEGRLERRPRPERGDAPRPRGAEGRGRASRAKDTRRRREEAADRKSTRLNSSHVAISYAVFCLKKKKKIRI